VRKWPSSQIQIRNPQLPSLERIFSTRKRYNTPVLDLLETDNLQEVALVEPLNLTRLEGKVFPKVTTLHTEYCPFANKVYSSFPNVQKLYISNSCLINCSFALKREGNWPHLKLLFITAVDYPLCNIKEKFSTLKNIKVLPTINLWKVLREGNLDLLRRGLEMYKKKEYHPEEEFYFQNFFCTDEKVFWKTTPLIYAHTKELMDFFLDEVKVPINQKADKMMGLYNQGLYLSYRVPYGFYKESAIEKNYEKIELFSYLASRGATFNNNLISRCIRKEDNKYSKYTVLYYSLLTSISSFGATRSQYHRSEHIFDEDWRTLFRMDIAQIFTEENPSFSDYRFSIDCTSS
jgi:hypothetical protein